MEYIKPSWSDSQQARLCELMADENVTIAYWCSDGDGRPANGGKGTTAKAGLIEEIKGPLQVCTAKALHATHLPHVWKGIRIWMVALSGPVQQDRNKFGSLKREFLGEILPEESLNESVGARLGRKDLRGANLSGAKLSGADLSRANLSEADLSRADLWRADLSEAYLSRANLCGAYLNVANLSRANLSGANLCGANLLEANLSGANLSGADLSRANLLGAYLSGANLSGANLFEAYLSRANLFGASRYSTDASIPGWKRIDGLLHPTS
jgi:hypothetical protein